MMVNIGAFTGKTVVDPLRRSMGDLGLVYLNYFGGDDAYSPDRVYLFTDRPRRKGKAKALENWDDRC